MSGFREQALRAYERMDGRRNGIARYGQIWVNFYQNGTFLNLHRQSETMIFFGAGSLGPFRLQKQTSDDRSTHFIDLIG